MRFLTTLALVTGLFGVPVAAQRFRIVQPAPDCNVIRRAFDNPFDDTRGYWQPRLAWHAEKHIAGYIATSLLIRIGVPRRVAKIIPPLFVTALHVRGVIRRTYDLDPMDWVADAWMVTAAPPRPWSVGYIATGLCFASP